MSHHHHDHSHDHGHGHGHGHDDHHDHDHSSDITPALQSNLYQQIDFDNIITFNEAESKSGAAIVKKTWAQRLDDKPELESDVDEQLLIFTGQTKLHALLIYSPPTPSAPRTLKLYKNRRDLDFSTAADLTPTQTLQIPQTLTGAESDVLEIPLNRSQFGTTTSITLFFEDNWSDGEEEVTRVSYVGFRGQHMALNREPVSFLYEAAANPRDHVVIQGVEGVGRTIGQ